MRKFKVIIGTVLCILVLLGCGSSSGSSESHEGEVKTVEGASHYKNKNYQEVENELRQIGFTNISTEAIDDLITGWLTKDGEVESVSIDGDDDFSAYNWYPAESKVVITYHTFPNDQATEENTKESVAASEQQAETTEESLEASEQQTESIEESTDNATEESAKEATEETLTVDNCEDLAAILATDAEWDSSYISFVNTHTGQTIEFDGCITYLVNHDDYKTRYDLLLSGGDYVDEDTQNPGPIFKFEDVNTYNLGIVELSLPSYVRIGSNIHIVAKVDSINEDTGIIKLIPVLITER